MKTEELTIEQDFLNYSDEINDGELVSLAMDAATEIRMLFANTVDTTQSYAKQLRALKKALEENDHIEFVNEDIFDKDTDNNIGVLQYAQSYNDGILAVDVRFSVYEGRILYMPDYATFTIVDNKTCYDIVFDDVSINKLACMLKGDDVRLQIDRHVIDERGKTFVWDGCHKLYIITTDEDRERAKEYGYICNDSFEVNEEIGISKLEEYYDLSCPLRFVDYFNLEREDCVIVPQGAELPMFIYY